MARASGEQAGDRGPLGEASEIVARLADAPGDADRARILDCVRDALATPQVFLPRLPEAVIQAAQVVDSPRCDVLDLADTLNADPGLATRVVQVANQSFFAGPDPVHTARDAIVRMGIRETRNVVMGLAIRALIRLGPGYTQNRSTLWGHSLATAACAQGILCELAFEDSVGFLAGLTHDLGRAAILTWLAERMEGDLPGSTLEPVLDALHASVGAAIVAHWRLRSELVHAIRWHHEPGDALCAGTMPAALRAADWMAHALDAGSPELPRTLVVALEDLGTSPDRVDALLEESRARRDELLKVF